MTKRKDPKGRVLKDGESYRTSDNRYVYRWTSKDGKRHCIYDADLMKLREKEKEVQHDLRDGIKVDKSNVTINDVYKMWKADKEGLKGNTRRNYFYMYEHFVEDSLGKCRVKEVTSNDVRRYYNNLVKTAGVKLNTMESIHTVLHQVLNYAMEEDYVRKNVSDNTLSDCKKAHNYHVPKRHALTKEQQAAFVDFVAKSPIYNHWLPLFTFFLGTGCRVSEVIGLRWEDVDMEKNLISINHNLVYYQREDKKCKFTLSTTKTEAGQRIIPMLPEVKQALLDELENQKERDIVCIDVYDDYSDFIFLNRYGKVHNAQTINRTIKRISEAYNILEIEKADIENRAPILLTRFSCHNLRHTFCTRYCENETNLKVIQEIMGHKGIVTTMDIYAEATKDAKVKSFENIQGKIKIS